MELQLCVESAGKHGTGWKARENMELGGKREKIKRRQRERENKKCRARKSAKKSIWWQEHEKSRKLGFVVNYF